MKVPMVTGTEQKDLAIINEALRKLGRGTPKHLTWFIKNSIVAGTDVCGYLKTTFSGRVVSAFARFKTAPTGCAAVIDINKNGTSIFTTPMSVAATTTEQTSMDFIDNKITIGDGFTLDIDTIGSTIAGAGLTVILTLEANV